MCIKSRVPLSFAMILPILVSLKRTIYFKNISLNFFRSILTLFSCKCKLITTETSNWTFYKHHQQCPFIPEHCHSNWSCIYMAKHIHRCQQWSRHMTASSETPSLKERGFRVKNQTFIGDLLSFFLVLALFSREKIK